MKEKFQSVCSSERSESQAGTASLLRRGLALTLAYLMIPIGIGDVYAQSYGQNVPPPPPDQQSSQQYNPQENQQYPPQNQQYPQQNDQQYGQQPDQAGYSQPLSPDQLDQLVAPVALYPDSLVAQVLAASTYPTQVVAAARWVQSYGNYPPQQLAQMANGEPWDPSVKSLTAFPSVLDNLAQNMDWTTQLGNAYYNQPQDVMEAVQAMRQQAYDSGNLRSSAQLDVSYSPDYIEISPANPDVVYVPYYNPWNVYGAVITPWYSYYAPRPRGLFYGGLAIGFGVGISVIAFSHWGWGWGHWRPDWRNRTVFYGHDRYMSHSRTVFNHGHFGGFDRNYARATFRRDNNGHAQGFNREQFRGGQNTNFRSAQQYRQEGNRGQQNFNRGQQNVNRQEQNRTQQNFNRGQQNVNRGQQQFNRQEQNRNQQNFNRGQQNVNRGQQQFNQQEQNRNQQNVNRQQEQNRNRQNSTRGQHVQNTPAKQTSHSRPAEHARGHAENHDGGHGHGRR